MATVTPSNPVGSWREYFHASLRKPLHPLYALLEPHLPAGGRAIELGCGIGNGVLWLLEKGFETTAVDLSAEALSSVAERTPTEMRERLEIAVCDMARYPLEEDAYDVAVAGFSLFFLAKHDLDELWWKIRRALHPGGIFMGQFLGERDDWAGEYTAHTRAEMDRLLQGMQVLHFEEAERDGTTVQGTSKHWHIFHVIATRPNP